MHVQIPKCESTIYVVLYQIWISNIVQQTAFNIFFIRFTSNLFDLKFYLKITYVATIYVSSTLIIDRHNCLRKLSQNGNRNTVQSKEVRGREGG